MRAPRTITAIVVAGSAVAVASAAQAAVTTLTPGALTVCTYPGFAPFDQVGADGRWQGWDATFITGFATQEGLAVKVVPVQQFNGIWQLPGRDRCDVAAAGIGNEPQRRAQSPGTTWSSTYYTVIRAFAVRKGSTLTGPKDLAGKTVIVTKGSTADQDLVQQVKQHHVPHVTIRYTDNEGAAVALVARGKVFAYGGGLGSVQYQARRFRNIKVVWPHRMLMPNGTLGREVFSFPVRTASTGVVQALNAYIAANKPRYGK